MQPERQVSVAFAAVGAALVVPQYLAMYHDQNAAPGVSLAIGAVLGALGVLLGSLLAADHDARVVQVLGVGFWILIALGLSDAALLGALHSPGWTGQVVFGLSALLPLIGPLLVLVHAVRERRR